MMNLKNATTFLVMLFIFIAGFSQYRQPEVKVNVPLDSIRLSDPCILADANTSMYYMTGTGGLLWKSKDLRKWTGPFRVAETDPDSWMGPRPMIWAAELHAYKGKFYYFATFTNRDVKIDTVKGNVIERRASHVLVSDRPDGPYVPMEDDMYLPPDMPTLDGTFWVDKDDRPYMVYCYEWLQNWNGTIEKIALKPDLSGSIGEGEVLFRASDSPWSRERDENGNIIPNKVTDGPWLFVTQTGKLGMLWTSWVFGDYTQGVAYSESGTLDGPWVHEEEPITPSNFGHGMMFRNFEGKLLMCLHSHKNVNGRYVRIPHLFEVDDSGDKIIVGQRYIPPLLVGSTVVDGDTDDLTVLRIDTSDTRQVIHNFGASDAWSVQFVGSEWPKSSRKQIAELLFSSEPDVDGNPKGIGLSAWRFNIGGGSAEQGAESRIRDKWRRSECFLNADGTYDWSRQEGQLWFLQEAHNYGVADLIGFVNSPPVHLTKNGKAWSDDGLSSNLPVEHYEDFALFLAEVVQGVRARTGITFDYISPFNEPQWEWKCCKQEGSPWNNDELAGATRVIDRVFSEKNIERTKIEVPETGQIDFLYDQGKRPENRSNQIETFFDPNSANYIGDLEHLAPKIAGHSYFSTWDRQRLIDTRLQLRVKIESVNDALEYWVTEYCILENNKEIQGNGKDLGMDPALYVARVIHADLVHAEASAWQWWLAVSPYDYKDGLIYINKENPREEVSDSKMLWALGNYSRFIRPGSVRIGISTSDDNADSDHDELLVSAFKTPADEIVVVMINEDQEQKTVQMENLPGNAGSMRVYLTTADPQDNLRLVGEHAPGGKVAIPPRSVVTCVTR